MSEAELVLEERDGSVAILQLNRPDALNALSGELLAALIESLERIDREGDARAIVIAGHDRAFAAGADLKALIERPLHRVLTHESGRFWTRMAQLELPLVAAVSGYAFGGGCELALACDLVVASREARFSQAEIKVGLVPGGGGSQRLARTLGKHRTMDLVLTGRPIKAEEAFELGFVNRLTEPGEWRQAAIALAQEIAAKPPLAVKLGKRAVLAAEESTLSAGMAIERRLLELAMATEDRVEGMKAFAERRDPVWSGR